jgi:acetyltransferase-like isoleucine patch superfamily enzyme
VTIYDGVVLGDHVEIHPGAVLGRQPKGIGATARPISYEKNVKIGERSQIGPHSVIYYDVKIGMNTLIGDGASIREQCVIGDHCVIARCVTLNYNVKVGDRTKVMDSTHITGNTEIGDDVFVSVLVSTANDSSFGINGYHESEILGQKIENGAMIGAGASLLPGVKIGEHSVVGSGSVVTRDVAPMTLVVGVPAKKK